MIRDAFLFAVLTTALLIVTGTISIPIVSELEPHEQNMAYALGRIPVLVGAYILWNLMRRCRDGRE